jgi:hypothetical protein
MSPVTNGEECAGGSELVVVVIVVVIVGRERKKDREQERKRERERTAETKGASDKGGWVALGVARRPGATFGWSTSR